MTAVLPVDDPLGLTATSPLRQNELAHMYVVHAGRWLLYDVCFFGNASK